MSFFVANLFRINCPLFGENFCDLWHDFVVGEGRHFASLALIATEPIRRHLKMK
jgi:hypothetical protein